MINIPEKYSLLQVDGNETISSSDTDTSVVYPKADKIHSALNLPIVATYNLRSLLPKVKSLRTDLIEREIDVAFLQSRNYH